MKIAILGLALIMMSIASGCSTKYFGLRFGEEGPSKVPNPDRYKELSAGVLETPDGQKIDTRTRRVLYEALLKDQEQAFADATTNIQDRLNESGFDWGIVHMSEWWAFGLGTAATYLSLSSPANAITVAVVTAVAGYLAGKTNEYKKEVTAAEKKQADDMKERNKLYAEVSDLLQRLALQESDACVSYYVQLAHKKNNELSHVAAFKYAVTVSETIPADSNDKTYALPASGQIPSTCNDVVTPGAAPTNKPPAPASTS
jgi:hypothetical protein